MLGFAVVTLAFAITHPLMLVGVPLMILLVSFGPRNVAAALAVGTVLALTVLGTRGDLWWFERGWPLLLGGSFVWIYSWRRGWTFSAQALTAVAVAAVLTALVVLVSPRIWLELDAVMTARSTQAMQTAAGLFGEGMDDRVRTLMSRVVTLQVALFPAVLGVSSLGALGFAVSVRGWLAQEEKSPIGPLTGFRFNDHLIWIMLAGLVLVLAPVGQIAERVGSNAVFFMSALYVLRGLAVVFTLFEGISILAGVIGGLVALVLTPILVMLLAATLALGLGDTWLNVRERIRAGRTGDL